MLIVGIIAVWLFASGVGIGVEGHAASPLKMLAAVVVGILAFLSLIGLYKVEPNQAAVLSLFGKYIGTVKDNGLRWNNPFFGKQKVSQRVRNFESGKLKVNELDGSPIEIAAVIVWQVVDSAEAVYNVDDYESFVHIQSESALRTMATSYPYDQHEDGQLALRSHAAEVSKHLLDELQDRLADAGIKVIDARISHLAYAPEIAQAMLQRQQANAVIAARTRIVARRGRAWWKWRWHELQKNGVVAAGRGTQGGRWSATCWSCCAGSPTQPIVNAGTPVLSHGGVIE